MSRAAYDLIVLGVGAVGSAALWRAAARGLRVLGIDRFPPGHDQGSSHGRTRIIRQAYFEHPDYVPLALRAYELWAELEAARGEKLFQQTGLLQVGPADGHVVPGVLESARLHGLEVDALSADACRKRFPTFQLTDDSQAVYEHRAGYLAVERCVIAQAAEGVARGATLKSDAPVRGWQADGAGFAVETEEETYRADRLIIAAGAWAPPLLAKMNVTLEVRRKPQFWFEPKATDFDISRGCPAYLFETPSGVFYGFPRIDEHGVKVAEHSGREVVRDPLQVDRSMHEDDLRRVTAFTRTHLPGLGDRLLAHSVCMYTMSPDEHFIIDRHPHAPQVAFAAGLSGHGFKFAPVLGEALVQLAVDGASSLPVQFLSLRRLLRSENA